MAEENKLLQPYADEHCGGDRYRAIYMLMSSGEEGCFDPYVDDLSQEEACFVVTLLHSDAIRMFGKENYRKLLKAEQLASAMGTTADEVSESKENPHTKSLLFSVLKVLLAVAATVVLTLFGTKWNLEALTWIGPVLIGLAAMDTAESIRKVINFKRIKTLVKDLPTQPSEEAANTPMPTFEECMKLHRELTPDAGEPISAQQATELLKAAKKKNLITLVLIPVYFIVLIIAGLFAMELGIVGRIIGCLLVVGFFLWQVITGFKTILASKGVGNVPEEDGQSSQLNNRQSLCVFAAILIWGLYLILAVVGVMVCVTI